MKRYPGPSRTSTEEYLRQMRTHSDVRTLSRERRSRLLVDARALVEQAGGFIERSHEAVL